MIKIITVANQPKYYYSYLVDTVKKNNGELITLGMNEEWQGLKWKFELMLAYLKTIKYNEIICFVDGYDVICTRDLTNLKKDFLQIKNKTNCKLVTSSVVLPYMIDKIMISMTFDTCKNQDLNSGCYIGYSNDILEIFTKILKTKNITTNNDQILLIEYCNKYPNDIYIDIHNDLFLSIQHHNNEIDHLLQMNNNTILYNNSNPYFLHGPGSTSFDNILNNVLGYSNVNIKSEFNKTNSNLNRIPHYTKEIILKNYFFFILVFIIIIFCYIFYLSTKKIKIFKSKTKIKQKPIIS
jgi:hypothetical protein